MDLPSVLGSVTKSDGVLNSLYNDLAGPGVRQVGQALGCVLETANIVLLPLRMLNSKVAAFERRNFSEIADRFDRIPEDRIVEVSPEIGVPLIENLSKTSDADLRSLFIELLASSADVKKVSSAHPSFVKVIESLSPDEARLLKEWKGLGTIPCLSISRASKGGGQATIREVLIAPPDSVTIREMIPVYLSNLEGLGVLQQRMDRWLTDESLYEPLIALAVEEFPNLKDGSIAHKIEIRNEDPISEGDFVYDKGVINFLPYGRVFQHACIEE